MSQKTRPEPDPPPRGGASFPQIFLFENKRPIDSHDPPTPGTVLPTPQPSPTPTPKPRVPNSEYVGDADQSYVEYNEGEYASEFAASEVAFYSNGLKLVFEAWGSHSHTLAMFAAVYGQVNSLEYVGVFDEGFADDLRAGLTNVAAYIMETYPVDKNGISKIDTMYGVGAFDAPNINNGVSLLTDRMAYTLPIKRSESANGSMEGGTRGIFKWNRTEVFVDMSGESDVNDRRNKDDRAFALKQLGYTGEDRYDLFSRFLKLMTVLKNDTDQHPAERSRSNWNFNPRFIVNTTAAVAGIAFVTTTAWAPAIASVAAGIVNFAIDFKLDSSNSKMVLSAGKGILPVFPAILAKYIEDKRLDLVQYSGTGYYAAANFMNHVLAGITGGSTERPPAIDVLNRKTNSASEKQMNEILGRIILKGFSTTQKVAGGVASTVLAFLSLAFFKKTANEDLFDAWMGYFGEAGSATIDANSKLVFSARGMTSRYKRQIELLKYFRYRREGRRALQRIDKGELDIMTDQLDSLENEWLRIIDDLRLNREEKQPQIQGVLLRLYTTIIKPLEDKFVLNTVKKQLDWIDEVTVFDELYKSVFRLVGHRAKRLIKINIGNRKAKTGPFIQKMPVKRRAFVLYEHLNTQIQRMTKVLIELQKWKTGLPDSPDVRAMREAIRLFTKPRWNPAEFDAADAAAPAQADDEGEQQEGEGEGEEDEGEDEGEEDEGADVMVDASAARVHTSSVVAEVFARLRLHASRDGGG